MLGRIERPPVFAMEEYVSFNDTGIVDPTSEAIRQLKLGRQLPELDAIADRAVRFIHARIGPVGVIAPMPRRAPSTPPSDLLPLAERIGRRLRVPVLRQSLVRVEHPRGGRLDRRRERFSAQEHARTMSFNVIAPAQPRVLVLDNVLTTGATMEGALRAVRRAGFDAVGLAILHDPAA